MAIAATPSTSSRKGLNAAIRNIEMSLRRSPRPLTIVYLDADQFSVMAKRLPWLELTHELVA